MEPNIIDRVVGYFAPAQGLKRLRSRLGIEVVRNYDIASKGRRNYGWWRPNTSASEEVSKAHQIGAAAAQELVRNNPYAKRIKRVIPARMVGAGIKAEIIGKGKRKPSKKRLDDLTERFDDWAGSILCDFEEHHTFYGLQWLWVGTVIESGGVFIRKHVLNGLAHPLQLQTFEQSHLDRSRQTSAGDAAGTEIYDGIQYVDGKRTGYWLYTRPTDTIGNHADVESKFYAVEEVVHIYLKERAGQHLGMTWFDATAGVLRNYDVYEDAKLMQQQVAALFALFVEEAPTQLGVNLSTDGSHELPDELEPGMITYLKSGQNVHVVAPPKADASTEFDIGLKQRNAVGAGISYEALTGDYSRVNFASGRMGNVEFYAQLEVFQKHMLAPALTKIFGWWLALDDLSQGAAGARLGAADKFGVDWTFPPQVSVEPGAEFDLIVKKVRNGMMSPRKAAKMLGENLTVVLDQWKQDKLLFGDLPFDIDPSMFSSAGNQLDVDSASAAGAKAGGGDSTNKEAEDANTATGSDAD